jgi:Origin of replication binding protein
VSKFQPTSRTNPCPSCGDIKGNCRHQDTGEIILCMTANSSHKGEIVDGGYKIIDFSQDQLWAILKPNDEQWSEEQKQQWASEQRQRREKSHRKERQKLAQLLPIPERDTQYRRIVARLGLNRKHRFSELAERRGLNAEEINFAVAQNWLCSWQPGREVKEVSPKLAGINPSGIKRSLLGVNGIGIAAIDSTGSITGFQIASDNREKFAKYIWLSSVNNNGNGIHLPSGEPPIFVWRHPEAAEITESWLVEGGLKSLITALKLWLRCGRKDIQVIGAAAGNFNGSIGAVLEALQGKVTLCPDAGSLNNRQILHQYKSIIEALTSKAYSVSVAWWGQLEKGKDQDIDELRDTLAFDLITPGEFFSLAKDAESKDEIPDWAWRNWLKSRKYTPDTVVNQSKFRFTGIPDKDVIIAAKSGLGSGKTEALIELIRLCSNRAFLIGYRNNLLLQTGNRAGQVGLSIYHLQQDDGISLVADDGTHLALCLDSIHHVDGYFKGVDIYLDETVSVLLHATNGGTLGDEQGNAIAILTKALQECSRIILLDGNLADIYVDFIAKISGKQVIKIENKAKIAPHNFKFIVGIDAEGEIKKRDRSPLIKAMIADGVIPWIASDSKTLTDTLDQILKQSGKSNGYVLNKDTSSEPWAKEFLVDPDVFIQKYKPDYFIISPTAESGVSVTVRNYFTEKFTFFIGVQGTNSQHQMLFRLRDDSIPHYIFCPERSLVTNRNNPSTYSAKKYSELLQERQIQSALLAAEGNTGSMLTVIGDAISRSNDDWWALSCQLGALDNFEMNNLRKCLIYVLEEAGHDVELVEWQTDDEASEIERQAAESVKNRYALELYQAIEFSDINEANKVSKSNPNKDVQRRIEKTRLLDKLPGIQNSEKIEFLSNILVMKIWLKIIDLNSPVGIMFLYKKFPTWSPEFIADFYLKNKHYITQQQRFYLLHNFEISKKRSEVSWYYAATNQNFFCGQIKGDSHLQIWALQQLNILQFMSDEYHKYSPEIIDLINTLRERKDIAQALNLKLQPPTNDGKENIKIISGLLGRIGLKFGKAVQKLINGIKTRVYSIDTEEMQNPVRLAVLEAIARKFDGYLESETVAKVNWEETPIIEVATIADAETVQESSKTVTVMSQELSVNSNESIIMNQQPTVNSQQWTEADWLKSENLEDLAVLLDYCEDAQMLSELRAIVPYALALRVASRNLSESKKQSIREWLAA